MTDREQGTDTTRINQGAAKHSDAPDIQSFHVRQSCNNQKAEGLVLIPDVLEICSSRLHRVQAITDANESEFANRWA